MYKNIQLLLVMYKESNSLPRNTEESANLISILREVLTQLKNMNKILLKNTQKNKKEFLFNLARFGNENSK